MVLHGEQPLGEERYVPVLHGRHFPLLLYVPLVQTKLHSLAQMKGPVDGRLVQASHAGLEIWSVHWPAFWPGGHAGLVHRMHLLVLLL